MLGDVYKRQYPNNGKVIINGKDITNEPLHVRAKFGLGYLPQESSIFSDLSVENNLLGVVELSATDSQEASKIVTKLIDDFGLSKILNVKGRMLSGGQRRKVEIARTLISSPNLILLDEPFAGIDPIAVEEIKELLKEISKKDISLELKSTFELKILVKNFFIIGWGARIRT